MMAVKFNSNFAETFVSKADIQALEPQAAAAQKTLMDGTGAGNDFWVGYICPPIMTKRSLLALKRRPLTFRRMRMY